jgi:hypothetical protein
MSRKKIPKIGGIFSSPPGENLTGSFCSGIRGTQDRRPRHVRPTGRLTMRLGTDCELKSSIPR